MTDAAGTQATTRIVRLMALAFGAASLVFGGLSPIASQFASFSAWWFWPAIAVTFGIPFGMGVAALWSSLRVLRFLAGLNAIGYLLAMATLEFGLVDGQLSAELGSPWILGVTAIATTGAAIAWRPMLVWPYVLVISALLGVDRVIAFPGPIAGVAAQDGLYALLFDSVFAALALISIRAGRTSDAAAASARSEVVRAAAALARGQERSRVEALLHDGVLATLLTAARDGSEYQMAAATQATRTLQQLEEFRQGTSEPHSFGAHDFVWRQQATVTELVPEAQFSYEVSTDETVPAGVTQAISEAVAEALRNSLNHADLPGRSANRAVHVAVTGAGTEVTVLDDGGGFVPGSVSPTRLGIAVSIVGRMERLTGGRAIVVSEVGQGTRVALEWRRP